MKFGRATQKFKILWLRFKLRVSFTVCGWESYTEIFSGLRKSQKMARNNAQGEKQHSGASTASTSASGSASAIIRVRSRPDPFLVVCRCFSIVTSAAAILCISVNILSAIRSFKDGSDIFDGIFRCYAVVIAMFVVVAETEWGFIIKFWKVLEYWAAREACEESRKFSVCLPPHKTPLEKLRDRLFEIFFQDDPLHRFKNQACCQKLLLGLQFFFPVFQWGPNYSLNLLRSDVISGLTIASLAIPQSKLSFIMVDMEEIMVECLMNFRGANNLIPMEIALKIAEKIRARERFAAYIVIPMWPKGNPTEQNNANDV
ncbi:unnamed protein product [Camellia sinensis]